MVPLAQDDKGHPNKMGHLSPVHYEDSTAHQPAYLDMTQSGMFLKMVCLDCCLLKLDGKKLEWHSSSSARVPHQGSRSTVICARSAGGEVLSIWGSCFMDPHQKNCEILRIVLPAEL